MEIGVVLYLNELDLKADFDKVGSNKTVAAVITQRYLNERAYDLIKGCL